MKYDSCVNFQLGFFGIKINLVNKEKLSLPLMLPFILSFHKHFINYYICT